MKNLKKLLVAGMLATSMFMMTAPVNAVGAEACSHPTLQLDFVRKSEVIVGTKDMCYNDILTYYYHCVTCNAGATVIEVIDEHAAHDWNIATIINGIEYGSCRKCGRSTPSKD